MSETLAILKLASKFCNKFDIRPFCQAVQVIKNQEDDTVTFYASNGHIAIKVSRKEVNAIHHIDLPESISLESIEKAHKVQMISLISTPEYEVRFPQFSKVFERNKDSQSKCAHFDSSYMALIFQAIEVFKKDLKVKRINVGFSSLQRDSANYLNFVINQDLQSEIKINIAIMPMKP